MVAFVDQITATDRVISPHKGCAPEEVERMRQPWFKPVVLQLVSWSYPYAKHGVLEKMGTYDRSCHVMTFGD